MCLSLFFCCLSAVATNTFEKCNSAKQQSNQNFWPDHNPECNCDNYNPNLHTNTGLDNEELATFERDMMSCSKMAQCKEQEHEYGHFWPTGSLCNCSTSVPENTLSRCVAEAQANRDEDAKMRAADYDAASTNSPCGGNQDPGSCCQNKEEYFKALWPHSAGNGSCDCDEMQMRLRSSGGQNRGDLVSETNTQVNKCIAKAEEDAKRACVSACENYANMSTHGCQNHRTSSHCASDCLDKGMLESLINEGLSADPSGGFEILQKKKFYTIMENAFPSGARNNCITETKQKFLRVYKEKCLEVIEKLQAERKRQNKVAVLLHGNAATEQNPLIEEYCDKKAEDKYGREPTRAQIADGVFKANSSSNQRLDTP